MARSGIAHPGPSGATRPNGHSRRAPLRPLVLVVDDDLATRRALAALFADELDADVAEAEDGEDARYALMEALPDVAVVDAQMPWPDGLELIRRMRADPATATIPVVGLSGLPVRERMLAAGCAAFVPKPYEADELLAAIRRALGR